MLGQQVDKNQDGGVIREDWQLFNEVHRDGVPWSVWDRELFESTVGFVLRYLDLSTRSAGFDVLFDEGTYAGPGILLTYELQHSMLTEMSCNQVVMTISKYLKP